MIEAAGDALQQAADGCPVLPRNQALLLPEVEVADALVVADVQELVRRNGDEIRLDLVSRCGHARSSYAKQIAVERLQNGVEDDGSRVQAVRAGGHAVSGAECTGERLVRGKAVAHGDFQQGIRRVADIPQGKRQMPEAQIIAQGHAGQRPKLPRHIRFGVPQCGGQRPQGQCFVLLLADAAVNDVNRLLNAL